MVASIDSMVRGAGPQTRHGEPIPLWRSSRPRCEGKNQAAAAACRIIVSFAEAWERQDYRSKSRRRLRVLWKSHGHNIPAAGFGFIEASVRGLEQFTGC